MMGLEDEGFSTVLRQGTAAPLTGNEGLPNYWSTARAACCEPFTTAHVRLPVAAQLANVSYWSMAWRTAITTSSTFEVGNVTPGDP